MNRAIASSTRRVDGVQVGDRLPDEVIPLTPTLIVSTAIASRDYQDVHHDRDLAQSRGSKDIFMNILTTNGLVGRYVTDWAGPDARLHDVRIRLGAPNYPYDAMTLTGEVTAVDPTTRQVQIRIAGTNQLGTHVSGTVALELPTGGAV